MTATDPPLDVDDLLIAASLAHLLARMPQRHVLADQLRGWIREVEQDMRNPPKPYGWPQELRAAFLRAAESLSPGPLTTTAVDYIHQEVVVALEHLIPESGIVPWKKHAAPMESDWLAYVERPLAALHRIARQADATESDRRATIGAYEGFAAIARGLIVLQQKGDRQRFGDFLNHFLTAWSGGWDTLIRHLYYHRGTISMLPEHEPWYDWAEDQGSGLVENLANQCREVRDAFVRGYGARFYERYRPGDLPAAAADFIMRHLVLPAEAVSFDQLRRPQDIITPLRFLRSLTRLARGPHDALIHLAGSDTFAIMPPPTDDALHRALLQDILRRTSSERPPLMNYSLNGHDQDIIRRHLRQLRERGLLEVLDLSTKDGEDFAPISVTNAGRQWLSGGTSSSSAVAGATVYHIASVNNLVTQPSHSTIHQHHHEHGVRTGDLASLLAYARSLQIPSADVEALGRAISSEPAAPSDGLGKQVESWIGGMVVKAGRGLWRMSVDRGVPLLVSAINAFYGVIPAPPDTPPDA